MRNAALVCVALAIFVAQPHEAARAADGVAIADLDRDVKTFLDREMAAHLADIHQLNPPQDRVVGAL